MGSWNGTCLISRLPIMYGDPVVAGFMNFNSCLMDSLATIGDEGDWRGDAISGAYSSDGGVFVPRTLAIRGRYNDYGSVEFDTKRSKLLCEAVASQLLESAIDRQRKDGFKMWDDLPKKPDIDALAKIAERGALHVKGRYKQRIVPVGLWMVHASVFDAMVAEVRTSRDKELSSTSEWERSSGERYVKLIADYIEAQHVRISWQASVRAGTDSDDMFAEIKKQISDLRVEMRDFLPFQVEVGANSIYDWLVDHDVTEAQITAVDRAFVEFIDFCQAMDRGRYSWAAVAGAGSQSDCMQIQKAVARVVLNAKNQSED